MGDATFDATFARSWRLNCKPFSNATSIENNFETASARAFRLKFVAESVQRRLSSDLGAPGAPFRASRAACWLSWVALGRLRGAPGPLLDGFGGLLGRVWDCSWALLGGTWALKGSWGAPGTDLGSILGRFGTDLGSTFCSIFPPMARSNLQST